MGRARRLIRLSIACILVGVTFEIAARADDWIHYRADPLAFYGSLNLRWVDDRGLTFNQPGIRFEKWRHDERGFRSHPYHAATDSVLADIICLGTSESYGLYESYGREWPAALAEISARYGFACSNASVVGMSPFQYAAYLDHYVLPQHPDLVVLVISPFSFVQGMNGEAAPEVTEFSNPDRIARMRAACKPTMRDYSRFLPKARACLKSRLPEKWTDSLAIGLRRLKNKIRHPDPINPTVLLDSPPQQHLAAYTQLMDKLARQLATNGVDVAFSTYPNSLRIDGSKSAVAGMLGRQHWLPSYSPSGLLAISREFANTTRAHCDSVGYVLIDLEASMPKDDATFADSVHLTDAGASLAASTVFDTLIRVEPINKKPSETQTLTR